MQVDAERDELRQWREIWPSHARQDCTGLGIQLQPHFVPCAPMIVADIDGSTVQGRLQFERATGAGSSGSCHQFVEAEAFLCPVSTVSREAMLMSGGVLRGGMRGEKKACRRDLPRGLLNSAKHLVAPECGPWQCGEEERQDDHGEVHAYYGVKIPPEYARTCPQPGVERASQASLTWPPQVQSGKDHHDRPRGAQLQQVAAIGADRPSAMQPATEAG